MNSYTSSGDLVPRAALTRTPSAFDQDISDRRALDKSGLVVEAPTFLAAEACFSRIHGRRHD